MPRSVTFRGTNELYEPRDNIVTNPAVPAGDDGRRPQHYRHADAHQRQHGLAAGAETRKQIRVPRVHSQQLVQRRRRLRLRTASQEPVAAGPCADHIETQGGIPGHLDRAPGGHCECIWPVHRVLIAVLPL